MTCYECHAHKSSVCHPSVRTKQPLQSSPSLQSLHFPTCYSKSITTTRFSLFHQSLQLKAVTSVCRVCSCGLSAQRWFIRRPFEGLDECWQWDDVRPGWCDFPCERAASPQQCDSPSPVPCRQHLLLPHNKTGESETEPKVWRTKPHHTVTHTWYMHQEWEGVFLCIWISSTV